MFTEQETASWWDRLIDDNIAMNRWLHKLAQTEFEGFTGHSKFLGEGNVNCVRTVRIMSEIALDELQHAHLLWDLLAKREYRKPKEKPMASFYWHYMNARVECVTDYFAVNALGERLAVNRFNIMVKNNRTPKDIAEFLEKVIPDEAFHQTTLEKLAGGYSMIRMKMHHGKVLELMRNNNVAPR